MTDLNTAIIRRQIKNVVFGIYTDEEVRNRSVLEVTSPIAFDALGTALPSGLYDPSLGPIDVHGSCVTCGSPSQLCPGHCGHIESCVPLYHPLTFPVLIKLLRGKCLNCHSFRIDRWITKLYEVKFRLIETGRVKEAMVVDDEVARAVHGQPSASDDAKGGTTKLAWLDAKLAELEREGNATITLTSHERSIYRALVKSFLAETMSKINCANCRAFSPKIRQDAFNKVFQEPLAEANRKKNSGERIRIVPATVGSGTDGDSAGGKSSGWESDDTDDEDGSVEQDTEESAADSDDSDDSDEDQEKEEYKRNKVTTSKSPVEVKSDNFMHSVEVEAQARLTWRTNPYLCGQIFGSAHNGIQGDAGHGIFFLRAIPVPPSRFRPPMVMGMMTVEHAQNVYLSKIISINDRLRGLFATITKLNDDMEALKADQTDGEDAALTGNLPVLKDDRDKAQAQSISVWIDMQTQINCYMDSAKDPAGYGDAPNGIRQLLERKEGLFRKHMMGKRVNHACRSVISPDPYIGTNEIGIPVHFARTLTYPTFVTPLNVRKMRELVRAGPEIYPGANWVEEFETGVKMDLKKMDKVKREAVAARLLSTGKTMRVGRQLQNGDMMLVNRQPTLHKPGIMAHKVRILHSHTQQTIRMHYANCNTYNADFDGDEMNCHFPQNDLARAESELIAGTDLQFIAPTDGSPLRGLIQDHVDSGVKLTKVDTFLEKWEYQQLLFASLASLPGLEVIRHDTDIVMMPPAIRKPRELWTGKQVITTLLHHLRGGNIPDPDDPSILPGISVEHKTKTPPVAFGESSKEHLVLIRDGELLRGVLDKAAFGSTDFSLVHAVYEAYGPSKAGLLLNSLGRLFTAYLQYYAGHSCRMEDLVLTGEADQERRRLVEYACTMGSRAAKAWADSEGGKVKIPEMSEVSGAGTPLKPFEKAATSAKIGQLLSGKDGMNNAKSLDGYMQSQLNPLASDIIKACLPDGLAVPFRHNTFSLMVNTGAKGSKVNQSQITCALGQQALEGRRVPRMSSGKTLPSFAPYDPNPRADGFITDRFLTGVRPQEYYFHCMAGREGLVDTAVKTSRSGYLQRCLIKHLEELKVCYDSTVRNTEGGVVQFLYGEDGIDPIKAAYLNCSSATFQYIARNHSAVKKRYLPLPNSSIDIASKDEARAAAVKVENQAGLLKKGHFVRARKLRIGEEWRRGALCQGWFGAYITKVHQNGKRFDLKYVKDDAVSRDVPLEVEFESCGGQITRAASNVCRLIEPGCPDPILSGEKRGDTFHRVGSSGSCVSEKVAKTTSDALLQDSKLKDILQSINLSKDDFSDIIASKYSSALVDPGEAVGSIAAQSVGEPSTQMTLNTFHLAGSGANVTLGIPRLREIIMTASRALKTPTMSVPLDESVSEKDATRLMRAFNKLSLLEVIASHGIEVKESIQQSRGGSWERAYYVTLILYPAERIKEAFGLQPEDIAKVVTKLFIPALAKIMKRESKRGSAHGVALDVAGGAESEFIEAPEKKKKSKEKEENEEYDDEDVGEEDGVTARFGHRKEMASYGDMDEEEKKISKKDNEDEFTTNGYEDDDSSDDMTTDDEDDSENLVKVNPALNMVDIDYERNCLILQPLSVDPSARPLLMIGLVEEAAEATIIRCRPKIDEAFVNTEDDRGRCLQTAGCNFQEIWKLDMVDHNRLASNDIWATRCAYGVEAARMNIVEQIRSVFAVYGICVDPRHLSLIADYMTYDGGFKPMSRIGMADNSSAFLQMSFETTTTFLMEAALRNQVETLTSPSANIVVGQPVRHGTGAFDCFVKT